MPKSPTGKPETQVKPDPKLEKRTRRKFSLAYKVRILAEADSCQYGELGALLRREKLYSNQLRDWRKELAEKGEAGLEKTSPGPKASKTSEERRIDQLEKQNKILNRKLQIAEGCLELQKKALSIIGQMNSGDDA